MIDIRHLQLQSIAGRGECFILTLRAPSSVDSLPYLPSKATHHDIFLLYLSLSPLADRRSPFKEPVIEWPRKPFSSIQVVVLKKRPASVGKCAADNFSAAGFCKQFAGLMSVHLRADAWAHALLGRNPTNKLSISQLMTGSQFCPSRTAQTMEQLSDEKFAAHLCFACVSMTKKRLGPFSGWKLGHQLGTLLNNNQQQPNNMNKKPSFQATATSSCSFHCHQRRQTAIIATTTERGRTNEQTNERTNDRPTDRRTYGWTDGRMDSRTDGSATARTTKHSPEQSPDEE